MGSFAAGFFLIPWLGVQTTLRATVVLNLLIGVLIAFGTNLRLRGLAWRAIAAGGGAAFTLPCWNHGPRLSSH